MSLAALAFFAATLPGASSPDIVTARASRSEATSTTGLSLRWNDELLHDLGLDRRDGTIVVRSTAPAQARVAKGVLVGVDVLTIELAGAVALGEFEWRPARAVYVRDTPQRIDFVDANGHVALFADSLMLEAAGEGGTLVLRAADLRIAPSLAARIGVPRAAGLSIGDVSLRWPIAARAATLPRAPGDPNWPGEPVTGNPGASYAADVFLTELLTQYSRCSQCDGPGNTDGSVVLTPFTTLANNRNEGSQVPVVGGDPRGTSNALWTADVPWYTKFVSAPNTPAFWYPYPGHDQHPYLVWNLYRLDADGTIRQVGKSALKHAFMTGNDGASCDRSNGSYVLGRACADTYSESSNDYDWALAPRSEVIPSTGQWGRCGSIFDPDCDGVQVATAPNNTFTNRMLVLESDIDAEAHPGATWLMEAFYVVRDDIDVRNTMGTRPVSFTWSNTFWISDNLVPFRLGPAIDRWVAAGTATATERSTEVATPEGNFTVAVRVSPAGAGTWRYDYAVMNIDYARAVTSGVESNHTLRVLSARGVRRFAVARGPGTFGDFQFVDADHEPGNDWIASVAPDVVQWAAPFPSASLDWGTLARFSFTTSAPPAAGTAVLEPTTAGAPATWAFTTLVPAVPPLFVDGFE